MRRMRSLLTDTVILHTPTGQHAIGPGDVVDFDARVGAHTVYALLGPRLAAQFEPAADEAPAAATASAPALEAAKPAGAARGKKE
jgi:hypothetical protein